MTRIIVVVAVLVVAAACDEKTPTSPTTIRDVTWKLESVDRDSGASIRVSNPDRYTVRFEADNRIGVRADCNSCGGNYSLSGSSISIGAMACTRAFCGESSLDTIFTDALQRARSLTANGNELTLRCDGVVLHFQD